MLFGEKMRILFLYIFFHCQFNTFTVMDITISRDFFLTGGILGSFTLLNNSGPLQAENFLRNIGKTLNLMASQ